MTVPVKSAVAQWEIFAVLAKAVEGLGTIRQPLFIKNRHFKLSLDGLVINKNQIFVFSADVYQQKTQFFIM